MHILLKSDPVIEVNHLLIGCRPSESGKRAFLLPGYPSLQNTNPKPTTPIPQTTTPEPSTRLLGPLDP